MIYRENDSSIHAVRIAPAEGNMPIPLYADENAEVLSFPSIYGGQAQSFKVKVSYTDIAKSRLRHYDRRCCRPDLVLYMFKKSFNEKLHQALQVCLRKTQGSDGITVRNVLTPGFVESLLHKDDGYAVFKNIRSSPSYWRSRGQKLVAMVRQLGKCTFFITWSPAESKWPELKVIHVILC